ncbi:MAG: helix-turn-helix transcriptional regulator [Leptolyngbyaceae cyanobacterium CRU_2_3]|nr:helix-turn-helix transcriptional regulator [Leptolyngbyaceae cyanobacterium CRU_2_3]
MGKAGKALKHVLEAYEISQNRLAVVMGIARSTVSHWFNETRDPSAEAVTEIVKALKQINEAAAEEFIALYLERNTQHLERNAQNQSPDQPA